MGYQIPGADFTSPTQLKTNVGAQVGQSLGTMLAQFGKALQLSNAESWLPQHATDPQLFLCLGRLSARESLWGKARDYFESCYKLERSPEVCAELGRLLDALGEPKVAAAYFREGLKLQEHGLPQLPMPLPALAHAARR